MRNRSRSRWIIQSVLGLGALLWCVGCAEKPAATEEENNQSMMTQQSENLTVVQSKEGKLSYRFKTPLLEEYEYAPEPYIEFRKGVQIETYNDSTQQVEATLTANYAIYMKRQQLWEAKGNVRGHNAEGNQLETEQLFWNQKTKRIYSNVDSKITQRGDEIMAEGFESNEQFNDFTIRKPVGRVTVNTTPNTDSTATEEPMSNAAAVPEKIPTTKPGYPVIREGEAIGRVPEEAQ